MALIDSTIIIADDLTGANDTALQFFKKGESAKIIIDCKQDFNESESVDVWAMSTESRNTDKETAVDRVIRVCEILKESLGVDNFYKKVDSTLRGNTGVEIVAMLEATKKDAAILVPAYIEEGRTTLGGYQLLNGIPIERTQCALDPKAPICESYIPAILRKDLNAQLFDLIGSVYFDTVAKGAGPITLKINELIQKGKKIIVLDAMSNTDLEQIALAMEKCNYDVLPCGSAGLANAMNKTYIEKNTKSNKITKIPNLARLIISGSATKLTHNQIEKLKEQRKDMFFVDLTIKDVIEKIDDNLIDEIVEKLSHGVDVVVHSSNINEEMLDDDLSSQLIDVGITRKEFPSKITDYLSDLTYEINAKSNFILIMLGGETSYKCTLKINSLYLQILDAIMPAIPLCIDMNGKIIVTKSGNFGTINTLVDILEYFDRLKNENL